MANVRDVAILAGVSPGTVSRVFNGNVQVKEQTKQKVLEAAKTLNYKPNLLARSLRMNETKTIGLIIPDISGDGFKPVIKEIERQVYQQGFNLILCSSEEDIDREINIINTLIHRRIDGLILCPVSSDYNQYKNLEECGIPTVLLIRAVSGLRLDIIKGDDYLGCYNATNYLNELGHKKIGVISKVPTIPFVKERIQGYKDALEANGITINSNLIQYTPHQKDKTMCAVEKLLLSERPTAMFSMSSSLTTSLLKVLRKQGLKFPDDISVICFGESEWNTIIEPTLSSVSIDGKKIAQLAAKNLFNRIYSNKERIHEEIILSADFQKRESCKRINTI